ncbi:MAG: hypothetical protein AB1846_06755 [Chloroflexota bacterium]
MLPPEERFARIGMIARWRPPHRGHAAVLRALCSRAGETLIGIGSSNRYNARNPFTLDETTDMLRLLLDGYSNSRLIPVPDLDDGPRWRLLIMDLFGPLDLFVTDNPYVASLLADDYRIVRPVGLVPPEARLPVDGTLVRREMARGEGWRGLVPDFIETYITGKQLDLRFRREFGLQTLALETVVSSPVSASHPTIKDSPGKR